MLFALLVLIGFISCVAIIPNSVSLSEMERVVKSTTDESVFIFSEYTGELERAEPVVVGAIPLAADRPIQVFLSSVARKTHKTIIFGLAIRGLPCLRGPACRKNVYDNEMHAVQNGVIAIDNIGKVAASASHRAGGNGYSTGTGVSNFLGYTIAMREDAFLAHEGTTVYALSSPPALVTKIPGINDLFISGNLSFSSHGLAYARNDHLTTAVVLKSSSDLKVPGVSRSFPLQALNGCTISSSLPVNATAGSFVIGRYRYCGAVVPNGGSIEITSDASLYSATDADGVMPISDVTFLDGKLSANRETGYNLFVVKFDPTIYSY